MRFSFLAESNTVTESDRVIAEGERFAERLGAMKVTQAPCVRVSPSAREKRRETRRNEGDTSALRACLAFGEREAPQR